MKTHKVKCSEKFFDDYCCGEKNFSVRENDRDYQVDDYLEIKNPHGEDYLLKRIIYILDHEAFPNGINEGYVVLGLASINGHTEMSEEEQFNALLNSPLYE